MKKLALLALLLPHAAWADRVVFLRDGRLVDHSTPSAGPEALLAGSPAR